MKAKMLCMVAALVLVFSLAAVIVPASPAMAQTTRYVNPDGICGGNSPCYTTIQAAIDAASPVGGDTIIIAAGTYNEHDITINKSLTIQGAGSGSTIIDGQEKSRVFYIYQSTVDMSGMTIRNGDRTFHGSGIYNLFGNVTLTSCTVSGNYATDRGGGIFNSSGNVTLTNCTIRGNYSWVDGGGIHNFMGNVTLTNCTVSGNHASDDGGGIYNRWGDLTMTNCTVSGNNAEDGGGIHNDDGDVSLTNCTVSGNTAVSGMSGGGIYNNGTIDDLKMTCTIVYGNIADSDSNIYGLYTDTSLDSIVGDPDPLLGPLQDNGGPTETHALLTGSPAIDSCLFGCNVTTDQRGLPRPIDGDYDGIPYCDVGAYEKQIAVGGIVEPVDKLSLLAPWLGLAALIIVVIPVIVLMKRKDVA